jgi:hypothetical protein
VKQPPPPPDHMTDSHIPKIAAFPLRRRQRRHAAIEIESQMVAITTPPKELVDLFVAEELDIWREMREMGG